MKILWHKVGLRHAWRVFGWHAGLLIIALACIRLFLPLVAHYPHWMAAQLGACLHRSLQFGSLQGRWQASGVVFVMRDITLGVEPDETGFPKHIPQATLKLDFGALWLPSHHFLSLHAAGLHLDISRHAEGSWRVNGIGSGAGSSLFWPDLWLNDIQLNINDRDHHYSVMLDALRLRRQGKYMDVDVLLRAMKTTGLVRGKGRFHIDGSRGYLWLKARHADLHLLLAGIDIKGYTVNAGQGSATVWLHWKHGKVVHAQAHFRLNKLAVDTPHAGRIHVARLYATADIRATPTGYVWRLRDHHAGTLVVNIHHPGTLQVGVILTARHLSLAPLLPWLALVPELNPALRAWFVHGHGHGLLQRAQLSWTRAGGLQTLEAYFDQLGIDAMGKLPALDHLRGIVRGDATALTLALPAQAVTLTFPQVFAGPLIMTRLSGTLAWWHDHKNWHVGVAGLTIQGQGFAGSLHGQVDLSISGTAPFLALYAQVTRVDARLISRFLPLNVIPAEVVHWLNRALVKGYLSKGRALLRGHLEDWPFRHHRGRFEAYAQVNDLVLDYASGWPRADRVKGSIHFVNHGMRVHIDTAHHQGVIADDINASMTDLAQPRLMLNFKGHGDAASLLHFATKSPIARHQADTLSRLKLAGSGRFDFRLVLPLQSVTDFHLSGQAHVKSVLLAAPAWKLKLDKLGGLISFDEHGFHAGPLRGFMCGEPSTLDLTVHDDASGHVPLMLTARLHGRYHLARLLANNPSWRRFGKAVHGKSDFTFTWKLARSAVRGGSPTRCLTVDSPLTGIVLDYPAPLKKTSADTRLPLHVIIKRPLADSDLKLALGRVLRLRMRLPASSRKSWAARLNFGQWMPSATSLPRHGLRIRGYTYRFDITGWMHYAIAGHSERKPVFESVDLKTAHALLFGHDFSTMQIKARLRHATLGVNVTGQAITGHVEIPMVHLRKRGMTVRLQRLCWPEMTPGSHVRIHPALLPPLHIVVNDLRFGGIGLGLVRGETRSTARGMHIDTLQVLSTDSQISASGDWNGSENDHRTHMRIQFATRNPGGMFRVLGFDRLFIGGRINGQLNAGWSGAPWAMKMANMEGQLNLRIRHSRMLGVNAGMSRLLSLMSLDLSQAFGRGLSFRMLSGDFILTNGYAIIHNLDIRGSGLDIDIKGRIGLRSKKYDGQVTVIPHLGSSLPLVGAVMMGGPVGLATGLTLQWLLGKDINRVLVKRYTLTGRWSRPVLTPIGSGRKPGPGLANPAVRRIGVSLPRPPGKKLDHPLPSAAVSPGGH